MSHYFSIRAEERVIMTTDVHDFSLVIDRLGSSPSAFLQEVYEALGDEIIVAGGEIIKYLGDGLLCVFPAGREVDAVKCALGLRGTFAELGRKRNLPPDTELEVGIGSGEVELGPFGHPSFRQKDIFGKPLLRAAAIGHHRGIAVTESVYKKINTRFDVRPLPDRKVKWQTEPLKSWEVIDDLGLASNQVQV